MFLGLVDALIGFDVDDFVGDFACARVGWWLGLW